MANLKDIASRLGPIVKKMPSGKMRAMKRKLAKRKAPVGPNSGLGPIKMPRY